MIPMFSQYHSLLLNTTMPIFWGRNWFPPIFSLRWRQIICWRHNLQTWHHNFLSSHHIFIVGAKFIIGVEGDHPRVKKHQEKK
jgi:hypothetical protein